MKYRRELLKNKITAEYIEQKGLSSIPGNMFARIEDDGIEIDEEDSRIVVTLPRCKWWERLPDEIKVNQHYVCQIILVSGQNFEHGIWLARSL